METHIRIIMVLTVMSCEVCTYLLQMRTFKLITRRDKVYPQMQLCVVTGEYYTGQENDHNIQYVVYSIPFQPVPQNPFFLPCNQQILAWVHSKANH